MNRDSSFPPNSSLNALRGAVGGVVGAADTVGCWDQMVWLWRIFLQLDRLMAVLWAMIHRMRAGETWAGGVCPAGAVVLGARPVVAGSGSARRRGVARVLMMPERRVVAAAVDSAGEIRRGARLADSGWRDWGCRGRVLGAMSSMSAVRGSRFSESGWGGSRSCVLIVPV
jgi:hypothetical protein